MRLYLVRHGQAKPREEDPDRSLTDRGHAEVEKVGAFLKPVRLRPEAIWHSGKTRARQTAQIIAAAISGRQGIVEHKSLDHDDPVKPIKKELERLSGDVMIVGHLPHLANLASLLISGSENEDMFAFPTGAVAALEKIDDGWQLVWMIVPDLLVNGK